MAITGIGRALLAEFDGRFEKAASVFYNFPMWQRGGRRVETSYGEAHDMLEAGRKLILPADAAFKRSLFAWLPLLVLFGLFAPTILSMLFGRGWWVAQEMRTLGVVAGVLLLLWQFARIHLAWFSFNAMVAAKWGDRVHVPSTTRSLADRIAPLRALVLTLLMLSVTGCAGWFVVMLYTGGNLSYRASSLLGMFALPTVIGLAALWVLLGLIGAFGNGKSKPST